MHLTRPMRRRRTQGAAWRRPERRGGAQAVRARWIANGQAEFSSEEAAPELGEESPLAPGQQAVESHVSHIAGKLWQARVQVGQAVEGGEELVVLESMKMEIGLAAPQRGIVREVRVQPGSPVRAGQRVVVIETA